MRYESASARVVVASFNIRNGLAFDGLHSWPFRRRSTAHALQSLHADLVGLQEVYGFQQHYLQRKVAGYRWFGEGRSTRGRNERCPVLVRDGRFDVLTAQTRWFGDRRRGTKLPGATFPRIATLLRLNEAVSGLAFEIVNTHLDERRDENRLRSVLQLVTWLTHEVPTVVVGDFNATVDDDVFSPLHAASFKHALPVTAPGTAHGFTGPNKGRRIDHILVSRHWTVEYAEVVDHRGTLPSDHWPVIASLRLT